jgi:hypothetical protein
MPTYRGSCHCGQVRFEVTTELRPILDCNCSVCTRKGFLHLIVPPERFRLLGGAEELSTYQFNTRTAVHRFCRTCGIHPFYSPRSDPEKVDVNVRCLEGVDLSTLEITAFDGRNWEEAIGKRTW